MLTYHNKISSDTRFYKKENPLQLVEAFGSPLYVYSEEIFRSRCKELKNLVTYPNFSVNYSVKANGNLSLVKIAKEEGLNVDAMSPGEIHLELAAGFDPSKILYISNNVSADEMQYAIDKGVLISVDSLSQLALFGRVNPGGKVCIRFNPGVGAGHHEKVVTGGKKTKFGVDPTMVPDVKAILEQYKLTLVGINQHIGSLFMEGDKYIEGAQSVLDIAKNFDSLEFIDMGGGFGIPYNKLAGQSRLDLATMGKQMDEVFFKFAENYGKQIMFKIEPGRYISAESGVLLGTVYATKMNYETKYIGTDLGFNVLKRPVMYDSHHDIEIYRASDIRSTKNEKVNIVGNICESGDIMAKDRELPEILEGDVLGVMDAGAYGYCMASNYNNRLRPAEVLITESGQAKLIRRRDTLEDIMRNFDI